MTYGHPAGEAIAAGKTRAQVVSMLERMVDQSVVCFSVEKLAYLHKGGRIGAASRFLGTLLNIKPMLLHVGGQDPASGQDADQQAGAKAHAG